jgi:hypothetical protein
MFSLLLSKYIEQSVYREILLEVFWLYIVKLHFIIN